MTVLPEELAITLTERYRLKRSNEQRRAFELKSTLMSCLQQEPFANARIWLIGSLQAGYWGTHSDVDLVVDGLNVEQAASLQKTLATELNAEIDLIRLETLPRDFKERVIREGELLVDVSS